MLIFHVISSFWRIKEKHPEIEENIHRVLNICNAKDVDSAMTDADLRRQYQEIIGVAFPIPEAPAGQYGLYEFTNLIRGLGCSTDEMTQTHKYYLLSEEYY